MDHDICHFEIPADDPVAVAEFYTRLFGWTVEKMPGDMEYWGIKTGGSGPGGGLLRKQHPQQVAMNYVLVECVNTYAAQAQEFGGQVVMPKTEIPGRGWFAVIVDPQGNALGLWEEAPGSCC